MWVLVIAPTLVQGELWLRREQLDRQRARVIGDARDLYEHFCGIDAAGTRVVIVNDWPLNTTNRHLRETVRRCDLAGITPERVRV